MAGRERIPVRVRVDIIDKYANVRCLTAELGRAKKCSEPYVVPREGKKERDGRCSLQTCSRRREVGGGQKTGIPQIESLGSSIPGEQGLGG